MAVGTVNVEVFQLRSRGQHDIGIIDRIGRKLLVDDGKQLFASQPLEHATLIGTDGRGIGVVDACASRSTSATARTVIAATSSGGYSCKARWRSCSPPRQ